MLRPLLALLVTLLVAAFSASCSGSEQTPVESATEVVRESAPRTASIVGQLVPPSGVFAAGIVVYAEGTSYAAYTDRSGYFELENLRPGRYMIQAMRQDLTPTEIGIVDVTDEDLDLPQPFHDLGDVAIAHSQASPALFGTSVMGRMGRIRGVVTTLNPLDSTDVIIELEGTPFRTVTDEIGEYQFLNVPEGDYVVLLRKTNYRTLRREVTVVAGEESEVEALTLEPTSAEVLTGGRTIFGRVTMTAGDGSRIEDYGQVNVLLQGTDRRVSPSMTGEFEFTGLPAAVYTVTAQSAGFLLEQRFQVDLRIVEAAEVVLSLLEDQSALEAVGYVGGQVTLEEVGPTENGGIRVSLDGTGFSVTTDSEGYFLFEEVPVGNYSLTAAMTGYRTGRLANVPVEPNDLTTLEPLLLEIEAERPRVVSTSPASGARDVSIENPTIVAIQFNQRMDQASLREAITITPEVSHRIATRGQHPLATDERVVLLLDGYTRDGSPLRYSTRYTVEVSKAAKNADGVAMRDDYRFSFTTGAVKIIRTIPESGATNAYADPRTPIRVYFNARIDPNSIGTDNVQIRPNPPGNPNVYVQDDPHTGWSFLSIVGVFNPDESYSVTIRGRPQTITGARVSNVPYTFRFRTSRQFEWQGGNTDEIRRQRLEEERLRSR